MKTRFKDIPRQFSADPDGKIVISDYGQLHLGPNEQISLVNDRGAEVDIAAKEWGYYATPSINSRLKRQGFKTALVENMYGQVYIMIVDKTKRDLFEQYCSEEKQTVLKWLDEHPLKT